MILYFSGTGNSEFVAKKLAEQLDDTLLSINDRLKEKSLKKVYSDRPLVFVAPTYAWRMPRLVEQWIERVTFSGNQNAYFVLTCGGSIGGAGNYAEALCKKKNFQYMGTQQVVMPENYLVMFSVPEEPEAIATVMRAEPVIEEAASLIKSGLPFHKETVSLLGKAQSGPVNALFYTMLVNDKKFYVTEDCIGCGKCAQVCPLNNIKVDEGYPQWNHKCTQCMACLNECPRSAIECGMSYGKRRYHCPEETWK
ncbi:MAG: EFR1 family ferrodoxin [Clostridiales bacterium]|nr:EFR1 family ferrodoxin [Candidatus Blautia equi]